MDHPPQHCVEMIVQKVAWSEDVIDAAVSLARLSCVSRSLHDAIMDSEGWKASVQLHFGVNFSTSKRAAAMFKQWYSFAREELAIIESKNQELNDQNLTALDELRREELLAIHLRVKNDEFTIAEANRRFGLMDSDLRFLNQLRKEELHVFDHLREEQLTLAEVEQIYHLCEADLKHMHREAWLDTRYRPPSPNPSLPVIRCSANCAAQAWIYCCLPNPQAETLEQKAHILASRHA
ncbi:hypothetical protein BDL97_01G153400 [Sphagnum fallax]|jgi:hypothetical protein|nr:hypothetical protein BDL97_01G153400 [Sphagnum fallax]